MCESRQRRELVVNVRVDCRQGCLMSSWLFNASVVGVMREVRERTREVGACLQDCESGMNG